MSIGSALANAMQTTEDWLDGVTGAVSRSMFESWVATEARTAAHLVMPLYEQARGESINNLTSDMLRMYLDGTTADTNLIRKVGEEISKSATFARLTAVLAMAINAQAASLDRMLTSAELDSSARRVVNPTYRDPSTGKAMYFSNADRGLQGVIGGVTNLAVDSSSVNGNRYTVNIAISDTYDFNNRQNTTNDPDLQAYVTFRNQLSDHIRNGRYQDFMVDYHQSLYFQNPLSRSRTFAAFMVAIERNGLTPGGVSWRVIVPFNGIVT